MSRNLETFVTETHEKAQATGTSVSGNISSKKLQESTGADRSDSEHRRSRGPLPPILHLDGLCGADNFDDAFVHGYMSTYSAERPSWLDNVDFLDCLLPCFDVLLDEQPQSPAENDEPAEPTDTF
jgi:hypothetical protein